MSSACIFALSNSPMDKSPFADTDSYHAMNVSIQYSLRHCASQRLLSSLLAVSLKISICESPPVLSSLSIVEKSSTVVVSSVSFYRAAFTSNFYRFGYVIHFEGSKPTRLLTWLLAQLFNASLFSGAINLPSRCITSSCRVSSDNIEQTTPIPTGSEIGLFLWNFLAKSIRRIFSSSVMYIYVIERFLRFFQQTLK